MSDKPDKHLQVKVPEEIHRQARIEAAKTGKSMQEVLDKLVRLWLDGKIRLEDLEKE